MAGQVRVDGEVHLKPGTFVSPETQLEVSRGPRFVSRGGEKLDAALEAFAFDVHGRVCADVGASTGGFTDCLLQRGAARVYAIDVGKGILDWKLRRDGRVVVMEETNARYVRALAEPVSLVTIDASFISLRILLPVVKEWLATEPEAEQRTQSTGVVALIKPQFEAGKREAARGGGVIRDAETHRHVLQTVLDFAQSEGLGVRRLLKSPLLGPKGNVEFLVWLDPSARGADVDALIDAAVEGAKKAQE